jgi:hypothetical protein
MTAVPSPFFDPFGNFQQPGAAQPAQDSFGIGTIDSAQVGGNPLLSAIPGLDRFQQTIMNALAPFGLAPGGPPILPEPAGIGNDPFASVKNFDEFFALVDQLNPAPPPSGALPPVLGSEGGAPLGEFNTDTPIGAGSPDAVGILSDPVNNNAGLPLPEFASGPPGGVTPGQLPQIPIGDDFGVDPLSQIPGAPQIPGGAPVLPGPENTFEPNLTPIGNQDPANVGPLPILPGPETDFSPNLDPIGNQNPGAVGGLPVLPGPETEFNVDPLSQFLGGGDNLGAGQPILPGGPGGGLSPLEGNFFPGFDPETGALFQEQPLPFETLAQLQGDPGLRGVGPGSPDAFDPLDPFQLDPFGRSGPSIIEGVGEPGETQVPPEGFEGVDESAQFLREMFGLDEGLPFLPEFSDVGDLTTGEGIPQGQVGPDEIQIGRADPIQPDIQDFSQLLQFPLFEEALSRLGAQNPFDARAQQLLDGPLNQIDFDFDEARDNLENRFAVLGLLDSPEFRFEMERLERDRALAKGNIRSQFAAQAAGEETGIRRGAIQDLQGVLGQELGRVFTEAGFAERTEDRADQAFGQFFDQFIRGFLAPEQFADEGLRLGLGGTGTALTAGQAASGAGQAAQGAAAAANARTQALFNALGF